MTVAAQLFQVQTPVTATGFVTAIFRGPLSDSVVQRCRTRRTFSSLLRKAWNDRGLTSWQWVATWRRWWSYRDQPTRDEEVPVLTFDPQPVVLPRVF